MTFWLGATKMGAKQTCDTYSPVAGGGAKPVA
jgi:hypothetical protein